MDVCYTPGLVSVIIPAYNAEKWIADCVQSAAGQTYGNLEIIVVDDGSTDNTAQIIEQTFHDRIRLIRQANQGQSAATLTGIGDSRGEFIAFLDSDDVWNHDKVEKQIAYMCTHPDAVALYTDAEEFVTFGVEHVSYLKRHALLRDADNLMEAMVACDIPLRSTVTVRRKFLTKHGINPDPVARGLDDIQMFMEIVGRGGRFDLLDEVTAYRRIHGANDSSNHLNRFTRRVPMYEQLLARCADCDARWKARVRRALSDAEFRVGEHYWGQGNRREARLHFRAALKAWRGNKKAHLGVFYTHLPPWAAGFLRRIKHLCGRSGEGTQVV